MKFLVVSLGLIAASPVLAQEPFWQCAAFARQFSGIEIRGDAWAWWNLAEGRFAKGRLPRVGAVLSFAPWGAMRLGHVATVTQVLGAREIAVTHANWSPINGTRGQIERDVLVRDVSDGNDWSQVRVWYAPTGQLGTTAWPVDGFIYAGRVPATRQPRAQIASAATAPRPDHQRADAILPRTAPTPKLRLGNDIIRLAMLEERRSR